MLEGKVSWYNQYKGYGFLDAGLQDRVFVWHEDLACEGPLEAGEIVFFDLEEGPYGLEALNVSRQARHLV